MSDYALQRLNMVESQVRPSDLTDRRIARAMLAIPRENFVPPSLASICYADRHLPISIGDERLPGRVILAPRLQAKLVQALEIPDDGIVLDVGCGLGYSSALLASLAQSVVAIDDDERLVAAAIETLSAAEVGNVAVIQAALATGYPDEGPYDGILINGAVDEVPDGLLDQLKDGGRLVAVQNGAEIGVATRWRRTGTHFAPRPLFDAAHSQP